MELEYKLAERAGTPLIYLSGRFDSEGAEYFKEQIASLVNAQRPNLVVNMSQVEFVDSLGLAVLVSALKLCRRYKGVMKLVGIQSAPRMLFEVTHLNKAFQIYDDEDSAFAS